MRRIVLIALPFLGIAVVAVVVLRRRGAHGPERHEPIDADLPEAIGEPHEELRPVHDYVTSQPRSGPAEAEAESRTRPSGQTLYDELQEEEAARRHEAVEHFADLDPETRRR